MGVCALLGVSSLSITNSGSNSFGSGPLCEDSRSLLSARFGRDGRTAGDAARDVGRLAVELDLGESWAAFCRACSAAMVESMAPLIRCSPPLAQVGALGQKQKPNLEHVALLCMPLKEPTFGLRIECKFYGEWKAQMDRLESLAVLQQIAAKPFADRQ